MTAGARRSYRGVTPEERDADRRARLIKAAMAVYTRQRTTDVPVAVVWQEAGVTGRQFYEVFADRNAMFTALYEHAAQVALRHTLAALQGNEPPSERTRRLLEMLFTAKPRNELGQALAVLFALGATDQQLRNMRAETLRAAGSAVADLLMVSPNVGGMLVGLITQIQENAWLGKPLVEPKQAVDEVLSIFAGPLGEHRTSAVPTA